MNNAPTPHDHSSASTDPLRSFVVNSSASSVPSVVKKSPRPRTPEQIRASQQNGKKSQGPKTPEGKANSRKNALKHGLSSHSPAILPPNLQQEVAAEVDLFTRDLKPQSHVEQRLVETAALSCVRFLRLSTAETNIAQERARTAIPNWQAERKASVNQLAKVLDAASPGKAPDVLYALKQTSHGCKLLAARYSNLINDLTAGWHGPESSKGVDAGAGAHGSESSKGVNERPATSPFTLNHLETLARLEAFNGTMPNPSDTQARRNLWRHLLSLLNQTDPNIVAHIARHAFAQDHESLAVSLPDPNTALRKLIQYLSKRKHSLTQRARHLWQTQDCPARDQAPSRALFDPSPEGKLLARYMNDAQRTMRLALKEFQKAQKQREKLAATNHQSRFRDSNSEISNPESQIPPIEPNDPQQTTGARLTPHAGCAGDPGAPHQTNPQPVCHNPTPADRFEVHQGNHELPSL